MSFCRMAATTTIGHVQRPDPLRAQLRHGLTTDLMALLVLEHPLASLGVESHPDRSPAPHQADEVRPVVQRYLALRVHPPGDQVCQAQPGYTPGAQESYI